MVKKEQIELFIKTNILDAESEYEKETQKKLLKIAEMSPEMIKGYFEFPIEWENNGLADLVRKIYKVG